MEHLRKLVSPALPPPPLQSHLRLLGRSYSTKVRRRSKVSAAVAAAGGHKHLRSNRNIPPLGTDNTHLKDGKGKREVSFPCIWVRTDRPRLIASLDPATSTAENLLYCIMPLYSLRSTVEDFDTRALRHPPPRLLHKRVIKDSLLCKEPLSNSSFPTMAAPPPCCTHVPCKLQGGVKFQKVFCEIEPTLGPPDGQRLCPQLNLN